MELYERSNFKITSSIARETINNQTSILTQNDDRKSNHFNYNIWVIPLGISKAFESIHTPCMHCRKMKFSIKDFFSKCDQIRSLVLIWFHAVARLFIDARGGLILSSDIPFDLHAKIWLVLGILLKYLQTG